MKKQLGKLIFFRFLVDRLKLFLVLVFLFIFSISLSQTLNVVRADNLAYTENFTTTTYKDANNTTAKWDTTLGQANLWGFEWRSLTNSTNKYDKVVTTSGASVLPDMALDSDNNPYIVWYDDTTGNEEIYFSRFDPQIGWSDMSGNPGYVNISNTVTSSRTCRILINSNNEPIIIWTENLGGGNSAIYLVRWTTGVGWTDMAGNLGQHDIFANGYVEPYKQSFQLDSSGYPNLAWVDTSNDLYFSRWDGSQWAKIDGTPGQELIDSGPPLLLKVNLLLNSGSQPYLNWYSVLGDIFFIKWTPGSSLCGNPIGCWTNMAANTVGRENVSNTGDAMATGPSMAVDSADNPYFIWADYSLDPFLHTQLLFKKWFPVVGWRAMDGISNFDNISNMPGADIGDSYLLKLDKNNIPYAVFLDDSTGNEDIYVSRWFPGTGWHSLDGLALWDNISANAGTSNWPQIQFDSENNPHIVWRDDSAGNVEVLYRRWTPGVGWTQIDKTTLNYNNISNNAGYSGFGLNNTFIFDNADRFYLTWFDTITAGGNREIIFTQGLPNYQTPEISQSLNINSSSDFVAGATLTATQTLNGETINYFLSNDGGTTWETVTSGSPHTFSSQGTDLRWRAVLATADQTITPIINGLSIVYQTKKIICSLSPADLVAGQNVMINAAVTVAPTRVWTEVRNSNNLLATADLTGGGGNYSVNVTTNVNFNGQNDVVVFASDGTQTYTCDLSDGSSWTEFSQEDIPWAPRYNTNVIEFKGKMWLIDNEIWNSDDGTNWQRVSSAVPWVARDDLRLVVYDNKIWLMGGRKADLTYMADIWNSSDGINWQQATAVAPWVARSRFALTVFNNKIYLQGGQGTPGVLDDIWSFDNTNGWQLIGNTSLPRVFHQMVVFNDGSGDKLYIIGGVTTGNVILGDVWSSPNGITWTQKVPIGPVWAPRFYHQSLVYDNKLWVISGRIVVSPNTKNNDVWNTTDGVHWNLVVDPADFPPTGTQPSKWTVFMPKEGHAALVFNNEIWVLGGIAGRLNKTNDVWHSADGLTWSLVGTHYGAEFRPRVSGAVVVAKRTIDTSPRIWLLGGYAVNPNGLTNDVWYSDDGVSWHCLLGPYTSAVNGIQCENVGVPAWSARWDSHVVFLNDAFYLIGGCTDTSSVSTGWWDCTAGSTLKDIYKSTDGINWVLQPAPPWPKRFATTVNVYNNKIWVLGGFLKEAPLGLAKDVWSSSDGAAWTHEPNASWSGRNGHISVTFNDGSGDKLWVMGGYDKNSTPYDDTYRKNDVWSFDGLTWQCVAGSVPGCAHPNAPWPIRYGFGLTAFDDKMFVIDGNWWRDVWSSPNGYDWTLATNEHPGWYRDFLSAVTFQNRLLVISGESGNGDKNDVWGSDYNYLHFAVNSSSPTPGGGNLPNAPSDLSCTALSNESISWNFTDNANNETGFKLRANNAVISEVNAIDQSSIVESGLQTNTQYIDRQVTAFNNGGESDLSNKASCYTLANTPAKIEVHNVAKDTVDLDIEQTDGNPANTVYAIRENNSGKYVQADGTFGENAVWQTEAGWGGENAVKVVGGQTNTNSNVNAQLTISLAENTAYSFSAKAKNGDGVETAFSDPVEVTTGQVPVTAPLLVATKGVAINLVKNGNHLVNNIIKTAQAQSGVMMPAIGESHLALVLRNFGIFLALALFTLFILLISGLLAATRHLAKGAKIGKKLKLAWHILSQEPAKVFSAYAAKESNGTYGHAYEKHRSLHVFAQKNFKRLLGLAVIDIMILSYVAISLNHNGAAQTVPYDQSGVEVSVGDKLSYIIELENQGTGEATGIVVTDTLNADLAYVAGSAKININGMDIADGITVTGQSLSFSFEELEADLHGYITFDAKVAAGSEDKTITNQAQVSGSNFTTLATNTTSNHVKKPVIPVNNNGNTNVPPENTNVPPENTNVPPENTNVPPENVNVPSENTNVPPVTPPVIPVIGSLMKNETVQAIAQFFTSRETKQTSQNVVTPILLGLAAINTLPTAIILTSYLLPYLNLLFIEPLLLFFRKKRKKWGIVYDSLTKLPVGLALVRLYSQKDNRLVQTKVTDKEGRYIMIANEPGSYYLSVTKPGYEYPSRYLHDEKQDAKYIDLYHGEPLSVKEQGVVVTANIPLDPVDKKAVSASEAVRSYLLGNLRLIISYLGITLALIVVLIYPTVITIGSLLIHVIFFVLFRKLIVPPKPKSWGIVYDEKNKQPLHYALVRILDTKFNKLLETQVTDSMGRYSFLVGKNEYQLLAEKAGYQAREIKPVDLVNKETIVDLDVGLKKVNK